MALLSRRCSSRGSSQPFPDGNVARRGRGAPGHAGDVVRCSAAPAISLLGRPCQPAEGPLGKGDSELAVLPAVF